MAEEDKMKISGKMGIRSSAKKKENGAAAARHQTSIIEKSGAAKARRALRRAYCASRKTKIKRRQAGAHRQNGINMAACVFAAAANNK